MINKSYELTKNRETGKFSHSNPLSHGRKMPWDTVREKAKKNGIRKAYLPKGQIAGGMGCSPPLSAVTKNIFTKQLDDNYERIIALPELVTFLKKSDIWNKSVHMMQ
jgi:hypothetical protein